MVHLTDTGRIYTLTMLNNIILDRFTVDHTPLLGMPKGT